MTLQEEMLVMIDDFTGGRTEFSEGMDILIKSVREEDRHIFKTLKMYLLNLYEEEVPLKQHAVQYRDRALFVIDKLQEVVRKHNCKLCMFLIRLILYKLESVGDMKSFKKYG